MSPVEKLIDANLLSHYKMDHFQEVNRREQEILEKKAALDDMKRKNQMVQDKVQEQIKTLNMKLEELRVEHMTNEATSESIISCLNDKLSEVIINLSQSCNLFTQRSPNLT